ncbi:hypothetical protein EIJ81_01080 (plasmid) [Aliivibrio salmonicida]|uniref:hypothetical protein n=1 Tax=Aliivibrio salmonicida TaxID=40269 RepID=UPI000F6D9004|nr:hypothetical protein [Aliivibrio salmonicida]AZL83493.1 hypothetical protein EIJ81_01080 [Aliivibrio salmonicida]
MAKLHYFITLIICSFCSVAFAGSDTIVEVIKIKKDIHDINELSIAQSYAEQEMRDIVEQKAGTYIIDSKKLSGDDYSETTSILSAVMVRVDSITYEITKQTDEDSLQVLFIGRVSYSQSALDERIRTIDANQEALAKAKVLKNENDLLRQALASFHKQREKKLNLSFKQRDELIRKESEILSEIESNNNEAANILRLTPNLLLNAFLTQESILENNKSIQLADSENKKRLEFNEMERVKLQFQKNIIEHNQNLNIELSIGTIEQNADGTYAVEIQMNRGQIDELNLLPSSMSSEPKLDYQREGPDSFYEADNSNYFNQLIKSKSENDISMLKMIWRFPATKKTVDGTYSKFINLYSRPNFDQEQRGYKHSIYTPDLFHQITYKEVVQNQGKQDFCLYKQMIEDHKYAYYQYSVPESLFVGSDKFKSLITEFMDDKGVILYAKVEIGGSQVTIPFLSIEPSKVVGFSDVIDFGARFSQLSHGSNYEVVSKPFKFNGHGKSVFNSGIELNKCDDVAIIHYSKVTLTLTKKQLVLANEVKLTISKAT